jgi:hypothetical protein
MHKIRVTKIVLGIFLTVAVFAMGMMFESSRHQPSSNPTNSTADQIQATHQPDAFSWDWLTHDGIVFFTCVLAVIAGIQAALFVWQLIYMRKGVRDAEIAANAAAEGNKINRENFVAMRRAWITLDDAKLIAATTFSEDGFRIIAQATIKNIGDTPAKAVWINFESYFAEGNEEKFADAEKRFKTQMRSSPTFLGQILFPNDNITHRLQWVEGPEKFKGAITSRPDGTRRFGMSIFMGVGYRIVGDEQVHITYFPHSILNVPIGTVLSADAILTREHFIVGEAD